MTKPKKSCAVCSELVGDDPWQVTCDGPCGAAFHALCTDLNKMTHFNAWTAKVGLQWFCRSCRLDFDARVRCRESTLQATIRDMFGEVRCTIRDLALRVSSMEQHIRRPDSPPTVQSDTCLRDLEERTGSSAEELSMSVIAATIDEPAICTDREESAAVSVLQKSKPQLSSKIWSLVFRHLNFIDLCQIRLVCSKWKQIVDVDQALMRKFRLDYPKNITIDRDFEATAVLPASSMSFEGCKIFAIGSWWTPKITRNLVHLELKNCKISFINLLEMLRYATDLKSLNLYCGSTLVYNSAVDRYSDLRLHKMISLEVDSVEQDDILIVLGKMFPRLEEFKLLSGYDACHRGVAEILKSTKSLERISLPLSSRILSDLTAGVRDRLKRVSVVVPVYDSKEMNEQLIRFSHLHPSLESFHLDVQGKIIAKVFKWNLIAREYIAHETNGGYNLDNETLTQVFQNSPKLKQLSMSFLRCYDTEQSTEVNLQPIGSLTELEHFTFNGIKTEQSNHQVISFHGAKNPKLTEIHLRCVRSSLRTPNLFALQKYIENAPNLRVISLESCRLNEWTDLFAPFQLKKLRHLKLASIELCCANQHDPLEYFDQLRYLELTDCHQMSEDFLLSLFCLSPHVEELYLSRMKHAGDAVVLMLSQKMTQLRKLTLDQCPITDAAVGHIAEWARNLKQLTITSCSALTTEAKSQLEGDKILKLEIK